MDLKQCNELVRSRPSNPSGVGTMIFTVLVTVFLALFIVQIVLVAGRGDVPFVIVFTVLSCGAICALAWGFVKQYKDDKRFAAYTDRLQFELGKLVQAQQNVADTDTAPTDDAAPAT